KVSRLTRSTMFRPALCLVIVAFSFTTLSCMSRTKPASQGSSPDRSPLGRHHFGDFSFEIPEGWLNGPPDRAKTKVTLLFGDSRWEKAKGMMMVDAGPPSLPSPQATAETFVKRLNGRIAKDTVDVDGEKGLMVSTSSITLNEPRFIIIVYRR